VIDSPARKGRAMPGLRLTFLTFLGFSLLSSCGAEQPVEYTEGDSASDGAGTGSQQKRRTFRHDIILSNDDTGRSKLGLANATAFSISLTGCVSTNSAVVDESKAYLELYEFDRNCLAKLTRFTLNNTVYLPKAGSDFDTWQVGDMAVFEKVGAVPADELTVEVISTITNPVTAAGAIRYQFSEITQEDTETLGEAVVRESASLTVDGQAAPNFRINQVRLVNVTNTGNGEFRIQLECKNQAMTGAGTNLACYDVLLSSLSMALVEDTYAGPLGLLDLQNIFTAAGGGKQIDLPTEAIAPGGGSPALGNGGFITANTGDLDVMVLSGNKPIVQHPNMIFVLKSGPSYTYYHIDVTTVTQSNDGP